MPVYGAWRKLSAMQQFRQVYETRSPSWPDPQFTNAEGPVPPNVLQSGRASREKLAPINR
jgi:hypothetical protein